MRDWMGDRVRGARRKAGLVAAGAVAIAAMLAGGVALAVIVDSVTLGTGLTVQGVSGLEARAKAGGAPGEFEVTVSESLEIASGWTAQVTEASGNDADLYHYFDCAVKITWRKIGSENGAASSPSNFDCETANAIWASSVVTESASKFEISISRNSEELVGKTNSILVQPQLVIDDGK